MVISIKASGNKIYGTKANLSLELNAMGDSNYWYVWYIERIYTKPCLNF